MSYSRMFGPGEKQRGRPKGSGRLVKPEHKSTKPARITPELHDFILSERWDGETLSDTIFRLIRQARHKTIQERKKVDALLEHLEELRPLLQCSLPILRNERKKNEQILLQNLS
jgi:hypothetical protein